MKKKYRYPDTALPPMPLSELPTMKALLQMPSPRQDLVKPWRMQKAAKQKGR